MFCEFFQIALKLLFKIYWPCIRNSIRRHTVKVRKRREGGRQIVRLERTEDREKKIGGTEGRMAGRN